MLSFISFEINTNMRPTLFHDQSHRANAVRQPPLKINKDSHFIKKPSPPRSSSSSSSTTSSLLNAKPPQQQRQPVIIYTHSPKVIHTHPRDFMALVQKLTGRSRSSSEEDDDQKKTQANHNVADKSLSEEENKSAKVIGNDDNESSSVVPEENCGNVRDGKGNSCFAPPMFDPSPSFFMSNIPVFRPNSLDFLISNQSLYNYTDSMFFNPNMRSPISSSSSMERVNEFHEF